MRISPADIYYSQDSIAHYFTGAHRGLNIGESLDSLLLGKCQLKEFPKIVVTQRSGQWYTGDNRRLWVFKKAFAFGKISKIDVEIGYVNPRKFTTRNLGRSILVRGDPGGIHWRQYEKDRREFVDKEEDTHYLARELSGLHLESKSQEHNPLRTQRSAVMSHSRNKYSVIESEAFHQQRVDRMQLNVQKPTQRTIHSAPSTAKRSQQEYERSTPFSFSPTKTLGAPRSKPVIAPDHIKRTLAYSKSKSNLPSKETYTESTNHLYKKDSNLKPKKEVLHPSEIKFSTARVNRLLNGTPLLQYVENIANGDSMEYIEVFIMGEEKIAFDNEKLWILQMAERLKITIEVPIKYIEVPDSYSRSFNRAIMVCFESQGRFKSATLTHISLLTTMFTVKVKPSEVLYNGNHIDSHLIGSQTIGEVLDALITDKLNENEGMHYRQLTLDTLMHTPIKVFRIDSFYYTLENRKLWLLNVLEQLGFCEQITLEVKATLNGFLAMYPDHCKTDDKVQAIERPGGTLWKQLLRLKSTSSDKK